MDIEKGLLFVEQKWHSLFGLIGGSVIAVGLVAVFIPDSFMRARAGVLALLLMALVAAWWYGRQPPHGKTGRAGIGICIDAGATAESLKVRNHFVRTMRGLIKRGQMANHLDVLEAPDHIASRVTDGEQAEALRRKMRAAFLLFGNVSLANHAGKQMHFLRMRGVVQHTVLDADTQTGLANEFAELLPRQINIDAAADLAGFEVVSSWSELCAKYVLAHASALSGQLGFAAGLFEDIIEEIHGVQPVPAIEKIRERAPKRLAQVNRARASFMHGRWVHDVHDTESLKLFGQYVDAIPDALAEEATATGLKAIQAFLKNRDVATALKWVEDYKFEQDPAWHFSRAFLYAYQGDLRRANQTYLKIQELNLSVDGVFVLTQVEEFLYWLIDQEPDKVQIYYCLGVIAWRIRGDNLSARKEFGEFLRSWPADRVKDREVVEKWLQEMGSS